ITLDEQIQLALAVVIDRLSPAERTAFVLHDVFGFPFETVAEIVGRTPPACRQPASRARRTIRASPPAPAERNGVSSDQIVMERFIAACQTGAIDDLVAVLDPDVDGEATLLGGPVLNSHEGAGAVSERLLALFGPSSGRALVPVSLNDAPTVVALDG